jgi:hypothetical protein
LLEPKKLMLAVTFLALSSGLARAQDTPPSTNMPDQSASRLPVPKALVVSGKVSNDGRTLLTDLDTEWNISNSEILKGREGSLVTLKCYVDSDRNQIRVLSVKTAQPETKYASRQGDSAFRR